MKSTKKVQKRSGVIVNFRKSHIRNDIVKAAISAGVPENSVNEQIDCVVNDAVSEIEGRFYNYGLVPNVENIYDIVEKILFKKGMYDVVREYILQREARRNAWFNNKNKLDSIAKLHVVKNDGSVEKFDYQKLSNFLAECVDYSTPLENVSIEKILDIVGLYIFDNIKTSQIMDALIFVVTSLIEQEPEYDTLAARILLRKIRKQVLGKSFKYDSDEATQAYKNNLLVGINKGIDMGVLNPDILSYLDKDKLVDLVDPCRDDLLTYSGVCALYNRYLLKDEDGNIIELPQNFFMRVALGVSLYEEVNRIDIVKDFYDVYSNLLFMPSTPTLFNSGTKFSQTASCYLNTVADDLNSIFRVYRDNAFLAKHSGGIATDWSYIRAIGANINKLGIQSQGVIPFLRIMNDVTVAINRSGRRRGATAAYLEVWHYEIEDFCDLKRNVGDERRRTHDINTAVWVPDLFVKRVLEEKDWTLFSPDEVPDLHDLCGKDFEKKYIEYEKLAEKGLIRIYKKVKAVDLWRKIIASLYSTGHPWICFKDAANIRSPQSHDGVVHSSNLCTEITLNTKPSKLNDDGEIEEVGETAVCVLGSLVLPNFVKDGEFDFELLSKVVRIAIRHLDNVIDVCYYPTPEAKNSSLKHRAVGLGCMGLQDALWKLNGSCIDSDFAKEFCNKLYEHILYYAVDASADLAKCRGPYTSFKGSKWHDGIFPFDTLDILKKHRGNKYFDFPKVKLTMDWESLKIKVRDYGIRNSNLLAIAPTATISILCGVLCPSIEPIYKNLFVRANLTGEFTIFNTYLVEDLKKLGLWNKDIIDKIKYYDGSIQKIKEIPGDIKNKYKTAFEIDQNILVDLAAIRGAFIDQSQSLNLFFNTKDGKYISSVYINAWKKGLKTTYYLRSLGASGIEKSSLDINKYGYTQLRDDGGTCSLDGECEACQ